MRAYRADVAFDGERSMPGVRWSGSRAAGCDADAADGNPLRDVAALRDVALVVSRGREVSPLP